jgi:hypothetical protein
MKLLYDRFRTITLLAFGELVEVFTIMTVAGCSSKYMKLYDQYSARVVCIRGGLLQPLHLDPQWSIVLNPYDR